MTLDDVLKKIMLSEIVYIRYRKREFYFGTVSDFVLSEKYEFYKLWNVSNISEFYGCVSISIKP